MATQDVRHADLTIGLACLYFSPLWFLDLSGLG